MDNRAFRQTDGTGLRTWDNDGAVWLAGRRGNDRLSDRYKSTPSARETERRGVRTGKWEIGMGVWDFVKKAGKKMGIGGDDDAAPDADSLRKEVGDLGLDADGLDIEVEGDTVKLKGRAANQAEKEKVVLAVGNVAGVAKVEEDIATDKAEPEATFHTVQPGDNLSAISQKYLGKASRYMEIFEANKPMLSDPDKIYPGQVLRIPKDT
jgi:nucleoid-associated protein YgaU